MLQPGKSRAKKLAEEFASLEKRAKDFDPEDLSDHGGDSDSDAGSDEDGREVAAREHYESVGKSKLRKAEITPLGPQYKGTRVSRDALFDEESDDPTSGRFSDDGSDKELVDDELTEGAANHMNGYHKYLDEEDDEQDDEEEEDAEEYGRGQMDQYGEDETPDTDMSEEEHYGSDSNEAQAELDRAELRKIMAEEQKTVAATLSQAAKADSEKGTAVKQQRKVFDSLLNTRIRLQKALQSTNSLVNDLHSAELDGTNVDPAVAAEAAAIRLWNSLNSLYESLKVNSTGKKRKHTVFDENTSDDRFWASMQTLDKESLSDKHLTLEKWSAKAKNAVVMPSTRRLNATAEQTITDVITTHLSDTERLVKRTYMPRSCAPTQVAEGVAESKDIYDDADFYGPLLKDLLEQRSQDSNGFLNGVNFQSIAPWQAAREAKTKKVVDTRASKGRKMRYTVQEKIQNFMAPEDRGNWEDRQREELFAGLFGRRVMLEENDQDASGAENEGIPHDGFVIYGT